MKNYIVKLTAVAPFHVGSGVKYLKKEYYVDDREQKVTRYDMNKIMAWIAASGKSAYIDAFERFMLSRDNNIRAFMGGKLRMDAAAQKNCVLYDIDCCGNVGNNRDICAFMRDAENRPYVPGSSLKGALRTVLLVKMLRDGKYKYNGEPKTDDWQELANEIENLLINRLERGGGPLNSIMSCVSISDSLPFDKKNIMIASKIDFDTNGEAHMLPMLRECAKPKTELTFNLTLTEGAERFIDIDYIRSAIKDFGGYYRDCYLRNFDKEAKIQNNCIFIGGGSGYYSKNIIYPLFADDRQKAVSEVSGLMHKAFKRHGHNKDSRLGISPHMLKCTRVDGRLRQLGLCRVEIEERR